MLINIIYLITPNLISSDNIEKTKLPMINSLETHFKEKLITESSNLDS
jgi:hypothetical protein